MRNIECTQDGITINSGVLLCEILPLINTNDIRLLGEDCNEIMCIAQGYHIGSLSNEMLLKSVAAIWNDECILNTVNIQIYKSVNTEGV